MSKWIFQFSDVTNFDVKILNSCEWEMEREISNDGTIVKKMSGGCRRREWPSKNTEITKVDSLRVSTLQILQNIRQFSNFISLI